MQVIEPFHVMDILARARALEAEGRSIIHMEIGEPDFETPQPVVDAGVRALQQGHHHYTPALGLPQLREKIAVQYRQRYGEMVDPQRIVVTPGSSGALQLVVALVVNSGDQVLLADPGYPCNRHFIHLFGGEPLTIPVGPVERFQLTADLVKAHWGEKSRLVMISSPSNPTGTVIDPLELQKIAEFVAAEGGILVVDEIYHGLTYEGQVSSAVNLPGTVYVVNSFSKYYGMTGWRLGWLVAPSESVEGIDRLAQNLFLAAPTPSQHAALSALDPEVEAILLSRRDAFRERRDFLFKELNRIGFRIDHLPEGAFYLYADCSAFSNDSSELAMSLLEQAGVAITPGKDFATEDADHWVRFAYTVSLGRLQQGVERIHRFLQSTGWQG